MYKENLAFTLLLSSCVIFSILLAGLFVREYNREDSLFRPPKHFGDIRSYLWILLLIIFAPVTFLVCLVRWLRTLTW